jgi:hypothetical protein
MHPRSRVVWAGPLFSLFLTIATNALADEVDVQPTVAAPPAAADSPAPAKAADRDRMVCRSMAVTGTRIASRVCKPASEWDLLARKSKESLDGLQRSGDMQHQSKN